MKQSLIFSILLCAIACTSNEYVEKSFSLKDKEGDGWGTLVCELPVNFDTLYTWINTSDCTCCGGIMYRSHSTVYNVVKETGFLPDQEIENGYYFTVAHSPTISCDTPIVDGQQDYSSFEKDLRGPDKSFDPELTVQTKQEISGRIFDILFYKERSGDPKFYRMDAFTIFNKRYIGVYIQSNMHSKEDFYKEALKIVKSIVVI